MPRLSLALVAVALLVHCGPSKPSVTVPAPVVAEAPVEPSPAVEPAAPAPTLRLPRTFLPSQYTARLVIDPRKDRFDGSIQIAGNLSERSSVIWLHGWHLTIAKAVARQNGTDVALTVTPREPELLEVRAAQPLEPGAWTLSFDYSGELDRLATAGAFKQTIGDHAYVYTQLEAVYARRVFPCFDEPDNKVPWKLTLDVPRSQVAVSNTPIAAETALDDTLKRVEFATTKPLPTYLVAFAVGPFDVIDAGKSKRGAPVRIVTLAKRAADAAYAAKTTAKILDLAEDWFGIPYPYDKLDIVTIPITSGFGAMENAGMITFAETLMLLDPVKPSRGRQALWALVAAHEIAHQWFGNLVTCAFWDDIWLNEGFANWVALKITPKLEPAWRLDQLELSMRDEALDADALVTARQIHQPIAKHDDIFSVFDRITYDKGASVLNMFEAHVGPETFQRGVREYLTSRAWGNATSTDFVAAIGKTSGKDLTTAFATFLDQAGAPELTATPSCRGGKVELALAQQRYLPPGAAAPAAGAPWILPVCVAYERNGARREACTMLDRPTATISLEGKTCPRWVMPNVNGRGYYYQVFTAAQVTALRDEGWGKLSWTERRALYHDVVAAVMNGKLPLQLALSLVPKLLAGNDRFTVEPALEVPARLDRVVPEALRPRYEHWMRSTFGPGAAGVGFLGKDTDTIDIEATRRGLVAAAAYIGREPALVAEAVRLAETWRELPEGIRGLVLKIAVDAKPEVFDRVLREVVTEPVRDRRDEMFGALASVRDPVRQRTALSLIVDPKVDIRETIGMLSESGTEANREVARQFFRDRREAIVTRLPQTGTARSAAGLSQLFTEACRAEQRDEITAYVMKTFAPLAGGELTVKQNLEEMDQCIARRKLLEPEVRAWLEGVRLPAPK